ncbi:MAG: 16S rRNA (guanine(966)-N(2))-methyltransferase RsmD [Gammaproteobacteria bacterium]|nr:16S rRNA (guanine(966)-N(2))-methyltransferase RsmD [Gammaproteobacteria bacterium]
MANANRIRIIGGKWRGRKLAVAPSLGLRPTPDRARETLFNWLAPHIAGARVLDLFAGTGALGFEALSRGAAHATFVERDGAAVRVLRQHQQMLDARVTIAHVDAQVFLRQHRAKAEENALDIPRWDLIFLDPPFDSPLLASVLKDIHPCLAAGGFIYVETDAEFSHPDFATHRASRAGNVHYGLLTQLAANAP